MMKQINLMSLLLVCKYLENLIAVDLVLCNLDCNNNLYSGMVLFSIKHLLGIQNSALKRIMIGTVHHWIRERCLVQDDFELEQ